VCGYRKNLSPDAIVTIGSSDLIFLISARNLLATVVIGLTISSSFSWASESCHIHPAGQDSWESEFPGHLYGSLDECESALAKYFGGAGRCHCFPDFMPRDRDQGDIVPEPKRDFEPPRNERRQ
jgi:hypothetical protein